MKLNRKYLGAVALLAVLAVVVGLAETVALLPRLASPQQSSSDFETHFMNPPTYDSGWIDIRDKQGQRVTLTHALDTAETFVDVVGKRRLTNGEHKLFFGSTMHIQGWNRVYESPYNAPSVGRSLIQTSDGGYAITGYVWIPGVPIEALLVKTNSSGAIQWNQTYRGNGVPADDRAYSVVETDDGGYALVGSATSLGAGMTDFWLVKTDSWGNVQWNKTYGGANVDIAYSLIQTDDSGYALTGYTQSFSVGGYRDFWLVKTDAAGTEQWNQTYGGASNNDEAWSLVQTGDGGYALAGYTTSYGAGSSDFWLVKTDAAGNHQWNKTYGGVDSDSARSMIQTDDGGYTIAGCSDSFGGSGDDFWLVRTDAVGTEQWNQTYGGPYHDVAYSLIQTDDRGYALGGAWDEGGSAEDGWLVKTDLLGNHLWNITYGGTDDDCFYSLVQAGDGGYVLAGETWSRGLGYEELWFVKTDATERGYGGLSMGLSVIDITNTTITLYRGSADPYWNYVRVRIWTIQEPTWRYGDTNQDGKVDAEDLFTLAQNYGPVE